MRRDLLKKYLELNIPIEKIKEIEFNVFKTCGSYDNEKIIKKIEEHIVSKLKEDDIDLEILLIEKYNFIKSQIVKNKLYDIDRKELDKVYEESIELLKEKYDSSRSLSINILLNMKSIIKEKYNLEENNNLGKYNLSFLYEYFIFTSNNMEKDLELLCKIMDISKKRLHQILTGAGFATNDELHAVLNLFNVYSYEELKDTINNILITKIETKKIKNTDNSITKGNLLKSIDNMSYNELLSTLNIHQMKFKDALLSIIMFGGIIDKTIDELSSILSIDKSYIEELRKQDEKLIENKDCKKYLLN